MDPLHQFYDFHFRLYDRIEVWMEGSYSSIFPMNNNNIIFCMMDRGLHNLILPIFSLSSLHFLLLFFYEHVIAGLELHGWIHWNYDVT